MIQWLNEHYYVNTSIHVTYELIISIFLWFTPLQLSHLHFWLLTIFTHNPKFRVPELKTALGYPRQFSSTPLPQIPYPALPFTLQKFILFGSIIIKWRIFLIFLYHFWDRLRESLENCSGLFGRHCRVVRARLRRFLLYASIACPGEADDIPFSLHFCQSEDKFKS